MKNKRYVVFGIGSNLGDRIGYVMRGVDMLLQRLNRDAGDERLSHLYETLPIGGPVQGDYINAALSLATSMSAHDLLHCAQQVEKHYGRVRVERFGPRTLDIDMLWIEDEPVSTPDLEVPHPRLLERAFALTPLLDVQPHAVHPRTHRPISDALTRQMQAQQRLRRLTASELDTWLTEHARQHGTSALRHRISARLARETNPFARAGTP